MPNRLRTSCQSCIWHTKPNSILKVTNVNVYVKINQWSSEGFTHSISASIHNFTGQVLLLFWKMRHSSFSNILELFCHLKVRWSDTEVDIPRALSACREKRKTDKVSRWLNTATCPLRCLGQFFCVTGDEAGPWRCDASACSGDSTTLFECSSLAPQVRATTTHTNTLYATSFQSLEKIHLWKSNVSN